MTADSMKLIKKKKSCLRKVLKKVVQTTTKKRYNEIKRLSAKEVCAAKCEYEKRFLKRVKRTLRPFGNM